MIYVFCFTCSFVCLQLSQLVISSSTTQLLAGHCCLHESCRFIMLNSIGNAVQHTCSLYELVGVCYSIRVVWQPPLAAGHLAHSTSRRSRAFPHHRFSTAPTKTTRHAQSRRPRARRNKPKKK
jgi:hypothetical protein